MPQESDTWNRPWFKNCVPPHHLSAMTAEIIWQRNVMIAMLSVYFGLCLLFGAALYPLRKTVTVIVMNVIFALETGVGIVGFVYSELYCILMFFASWSATTFMFLLYFLAVSLAKGDWMLWAVHGVPMMIDLICIGLAAKMTLAYVKWRKSIPNERRAAAPQWQPPARSSQTSQAPLVVGRTSKSSAGDSRPSVMRELDLEMPDEDGRDTCQICMVYRSNCCLVPCGHCICMACGENVVATGCPICRTAISQLVRVYK
eukprot:gnl/MRDRNA2_/MRDRNA2_260515_c0_seq1.p1 gnl/MRDRNA2_/MRDRNA2_260515_c0~~gnl/MRDRNA2_/MRDRNA2_260515_c0_seq1.p1  ORF type:complete len:294 (+),score=18.88 gnl/MRDRNA2_/MRDRNA2_260515_c0_seq1:111-884(+)